MVLAVVVILMVLFGLGVDGGFGGIVDRLAAQDKNLVAPLNPGTPLYHSWWAVVAIVLAGVAGVLIAPTLTLEQTLPGT